MASWTDHDHMDDLAALDTRERAVLGFGEDYRPDYEPDQEGEDDDSDAE